MDDKLLERIAIALERVAVALEAHNAFPFILYPTYEECQHDYPNPWHSITAPTCTKCSKPAYITGETF